MTLCCFLSPHFFFILFTRCFSCQAPTNWMPGRGYSSSILVTRCLPRLDYRLCLKSGVRSSPRRDGWTREQQRMLQEFLPNLLVAGNVISGQSWARPHDAYTACNICPCAVVTTSSFHFGLSTYFVWHYYCGRALYAVFNRRIMFKRVEDSCLTVEWQMSGQR